MVFLVDVNPELRLSVYLYERLVDTSLRVRQRLQTRAEIVRVAFELFGKFGFEKVSVEMIAASRGYFAGDVLQLLSAKELILREVASARA